MIRKLLTTVLLLNLVVTVATAQSNCPYCRGTGTVVKNIMVSQFGTTDYKVKCPTCGAVTMRSSGHSHISCSHCGGTGKSSSGTKSNTTTYDPDSPEAMWARGVAYDIKYGLPYTDEEDAATKRLEQSNPEMAQNWKRYRNILNAGTIYFNQQYALSHYRFDTVQSIDAMKNNNDQALAKIAPSLNLPSDMYAVYQQLYAKYQAAYIDYRSITAKMQAVRNLQEQLDDYILRKNMFY